MHPVEIKTRDGLTEVSYLTLPPGSDANGDGKPDKPVPLVLLVHGGPWGRDTYGYNGLHQWLGNRGYAVLSTNFRASTGFGKSYMNAGDREWGRKMHDDLLDAVDWAVKSGVTSRDKVAIMGGSYGGYATLVGMTFTPETFACGVDIVRTVEPRHPALDDPALLAAARTQFNRSIGDPSTPRRQGPAQGALAALQGRRHQAAAADRQGANDPRVNQAESDQIVQAMKAKNIPVTYVLFPDEGHGFARPENNIAFYATSEQFLSKCLAGAPSPTARPSPARRSPCPTAAEFAPGLQAALGTRAVAAK
jgi:dipeptidyl aminopeptidase/acylaminoacyl peptidase